MGAARARAFSFGAAMFCLSSAQAAPGLPEGCTGASSAANAHTCGHGKFGPFASVASQPSSELLLLNQVNAPHTLYTVSLSGEPLANESVVGYSPLESGAYGFYQDNDYPLRIEDSAGLPVEPVLVDTTFQTCPDELRMLRVFDLTALEPYRVVLGPTADRSVAVAIEHMASFSEQFYPDRDGDGWAGAGDVLVSWCGAISGYVLAAGDCDDTNDRVFPLASETCNGINDDCIGGADDTAGICAGHAVGTRCISRVPGEAACGCATDADCKEPVQRCDAASHSCTELVGGAGGEAGHAGADGGVGGEGGTTSGRTGQAGTRAGSVHSAGESGAPPQEGVGGEPKVDGTGGASRGHAGMNGGAPLQDESPQPAETTGCGCRISSQSHSFAIVPMLAVLGLARCWRRRGRAPAIELQ
jgi:hypothetical protein